ncbi:unnamed protein product, partial [Closterium sp. NIES-54]
EELQKFFPVHSYGRCLNNRPFEHDKLAVIQRYKFSLAFENSCEPDYITEKFWQSLVAGSVPVVVGPPNIADFVPDNSSFLYIQVRFLWWWTCPTLPISCRTTPPSSTFSNSGGQSPVAGSVPVVVGPPNIADFVPDNSSFLYIQSLVAGSVPVVVGPPNIADLVPGNTSYLYIQVRIRCFVWLWVMRRILSAVPCCRVHARGGGPPNIADFLPDNSSFLYIQVSVCSCVLLSVLGRVMLAGRQSQHC